MTSTDSHEYCGRHRGRDPLFVGQLVVEAHEVVQLGGEIHLTGRRALDFLDEALERQQDVAMGIGSELAQGQQVLHEHEFLGHGFATPGRRTFTATVVPSSSVALCT